MKNNLWKIMVLGIILLFLEASTISAVNTNITNAGKIIKPITLSNFYKNIYTVDDEGDGDFTTIIDAVNSANDGDIIEVYSGEYFDNNIIVEKSIEIKGMDKELGIGDDTGKPVINLTGKKIGFMLLADSISISNINMTNITLDLVPGNSASILIQSNLNNIYDNTFFIDSLGEYQGISIYINQSNNNKIVNNFFYNTFGGVMIFVGKNNNISNNHFFGDNAVWLVGSGNNVIHRNEFASCIIGVLCEEYCNNNIISYNNFNFNGMVIMLTHSDSNIIEYNNFIDMGKTTTFVSSHKTRWYGNYWGTPSIGIPKVIWGFILGLVPWVNFDWHPAKEPNKII